MVDTECHVFCQALYKCIEGEDWRELHDAYNEMSRAVGVEKPQEALKAQVLWKMKAAKDAGEEYHDPTREGNILGRNKTRLALWEEHLKDPMVALDKALKCVGKFESEVSARVLGGRSVLHWLALASSRVCGNSRSGRAFSDGQCVFTHSVHGVECAREVRAARRALFLLFKKELATMPDGETFSPFNNAEIRTPFFSAVFLRSALLSPCT